MKTWLALFKGINVGGNNKVPMKELVGMLEHLGFQQVRYYIQSGNVIFRSTGSSRNALTKSITDAMQRTFGFATHLLLVSEAELDQAIDNNPFPELKSDAEAKLFHVYFLDQPVDQIDQDRLAKVMQPGERWKCHGSLFYLHTPGGAGNSKLATQVEKITGRLATARNWRTVTTLAQMLKELP